MTFRYDDDSSTDNSPLNGRAEQSSPVEHQIICHHTDGSFQDVLGDEEEEEHFPLGPLDDDIWQEEPVPDSHLCIHNQSQPHDLCHYPCPYSLDQLHPISGIIQTPHYKIMDLSDIFSFPEVMTTASNEDIPDLEDVSGP